MSKPSATEIAAIRAFMTWGAKKSEFPYGTIGYWLAAYERGDDKDMYGKRLTPTTRS